MGFLIGGEEQPSRRGRRPGKGAGVSSEAQIELFVPGPESGKDGKAMTKNVFVLFEGFESKQARSSAAPPPRATVTEAAASDQPAALPAKAHATFAVRWVPADEKMFEEDPDAPKAIKAERPENQRLHYPTDLGVPKKDFCGHVSRSDRMFHGLGQKSAF